MTAPVTTLIHDVSYRAHDALAVGHYGGDLVTLANCRGCGQPVSASDVFVDLGLAPLANTLVEHGNQARPEVRYPLRAVFCRRCTLVQLPDIPSAPSDKDLFPPTYPFRSGFSPPWANHCREFADMAQERFELGPLSSVLEIGSNDGCGLARFRGLGIPALGVEPSREAAEEALRAGFATAIGWWTEEYGKAMRDTGYKADLVIARNVLAHTPDTQDFLRGIRAVLAPGGTAVIEVPYIRRLIEQGAWDQVYHEHHCYFSMWSLDYALRTVGLLPVDAEVIEMHGGSLRVYAQAPSTEAPVSTTANTAYDLKIADLNDGYTDFGTLQSFVKVPGQDKLLAWHKLLQEFRRWGRPDTDRVVVGYGASAKAATKLNYYGMGQEAIRFIADISSTKWGKYVPGVRIPIRSEKQLAEAEPDVVVNFCWNWRLESERRIREACPKARIIYL